jgi:NADH-quinone oxidoreductase subunit G
VIGSNLRKDHPLFALRVRGAVRNGAVVSVIHDVQNDWAMPIANTVVTPAANWAQALADVAAAVAAEKGAAAPVQGKPT